MQQRLPTMSLSWATGAQKTSSASSEATTAASGSSGRAASCTVCTDQVSSCLSTKYWHSSVKESCGEKKSLVLFCQYSSYNVKGFNQQCGPWNTTGFLLQTYVLQCNASDSLFLGVGRVIYIDDGVMILDFVALVAMNSVNCKLAIMKSDNFYPQNKSHVEDKDSVPSLNSADRISSRSHISLIKTHKTLTWILLSPTFCLTAILVKPEHLVWGWDKVLHIADEIEIFLSFCKIWLSEHQIWFSYFAHVH